MVAADPDLAIGGRHRKRIDAGTLGLVAQRLSVRQMIGKSAPPAPPADTGFAVTGIAQINIVRHVYRPQLHVVIEQAGGALVPTRQNTRCRHEKRGKPEPAPRYISAENLENGG